jgi:hypothetical protein
MAQNKNITFHQYLKGKEATIEDLKSYLAGLDEWWNSEFKIATDASLDNNAYSVREAICALANTNGGEIFLGISNDKQIIGTNFTYERLSEILRQSNAPRADWYIIDLNEVIKQSPIIVILDQDKKAYILEIRRPGVPIFIQDNGKMNAPRRIGNQTLKSDGLTTINIYRTMKREEILRTCYIEFRTFTQRIHQGYSAWSLGLGLKFPYLIKRMEDGSFYNELRPEDIRQLVGKKSNSGGIYGGLFGGIIELNFEIDIILRRIDRPQEKEQEIHEAISGHERHFNNNLTEFKRYLEKEGISVPEDIENE